MWTDDNATCLFIFTRKTLTTIEKYAFAVGCVVEQGLSARDFLKIYWIDVQDRPVLYIK